MEIPLDDTSCRGTQHQSVLGRARLFLCLPRADAQKPDKNVEPRFLGCFVAMEGWSNGNLVPHTTALYGTQHRNRETNTAARNTYFAAQGDTTFYTSSPKVCWILVPSIEKYEGGIRQNKNIHTHRHTKSTAFWSAREGPYRGRTPRKTKQDKGRHGAQGAKSETRNHTTYRTSNATTLLSLALLRTTARGQQYTILRAHT